MKRATAELIADVAEALEKFKEFKPLYVAVLKQTKCRKQALQAVKWAVKTAEEIEEEK